MSGTFHRHLWLIAICEPWCWNMCQHLPHNWPKYRRIYHTWSIWNIVIARDTYIHTTFTTSLTKVFQVSARPLPLGASSQVTSGTWRSWLSISSSSSKSSIDRRLEGPWVVNQALQHWPGKRVMGCGPDWWQKIGKGHPNKLQLDGFDAGPPRLWFLRYKMANTLRRPPWWISLSSQSEGASRTWL